MRVQTRTRLFLVTMLPVLASGVAVVLFLGYDAARDARSQAWDTLGRVRDALVAHPAVSLGAIESLGEAIRLTGEASGVRVTVIAPDGRVLADSEVPRDRVGAMDNHGDRPEVRAAMEAGQGRSGRTSETLHAPMVYLATRLDGPEGSRVLRLSYAVETVREGSVRQALAILGVTLGAMVLGGLGAWIVASLVARRVRRMARAAARIADGQYDERLDVLGDDELAHLGRALNRLAAANAATFSRLEAEGRRVRAIVDAMHQGVLATDSDGHVVLSNRAMTDLASLPGPGDGAQEPEPAWIPEVREALREAREGPAVVREVTRSHPRSAVLLIHASPLPDPGGVLVVVSDTTELHRMHQMRRDFVANVSHELRNPIGTLQAALETLRDVRATPGPLTDEDAELQARLIDTMSRQTDRMARLVRDLLDLARIETGQVVPAPREVNLAGLLEDMVQVYRSAAQRRQIALDVTGDAAACVLVDPDALQTVLGNLLDNAIKYARPGDAVRIRHRRLSDGATEIDVEDTGPGIGESHLPRLFERFYRVDDGRSRELGGTGLGLAIVKHLCAVIGASIGVHSVVGSGTTFTIRLPATARSA